ncbi:MAG: NADH-quinone oxidoreductase subunit K [Clostridiales bacterium]|nr:NADH-quinone oxidoreductase subunit K [Clostridiales bacterium]
MNALLEEIASTDFMTMLGITVLVTVFLAFITAFFCFLLTRNIIRVVIAIEVMMKGVTLILIFAGAVTGKYDLAQAFVISMIVVEVIVAVVAAGIAVNVYRHTGSLDIRKLMKPN